LGHDHAQLPAKKVGVPLGKSHTVIWQLIRGLCAWSVANGEIIVFKKTTYFVVGRAVIRPLR
jgi:hypothetical protein